MRNMVGQWNNCKTQLGKYAPTVAAAPVIVVLTGYAVNSTKPLNENGDERKHSLFSPFFTFIHFEVKQEIKKCTFL